MGQKEWVALKRAPRAIDKRGQAKGLTPDRVCPEWG